MYRQFTRSHLLLAAIGVATAACSDPPPSACLLSVEPGLSLEVREAGTNAPAAYGALALATDGSYQDTLRMPGGSDSAGAFLEGAIERAGTYTLHIERLGYGAWDTTGVAVLEGACHVQTVRLTVRLAPE